MTAEGIDTAPPATSEVFNYHLLRNALDTFGRNLTQLNEEQYDAAYRKASKSFEMESLAIAAPEAQGIVISESQLDQAVNEVACRYESKEDFIADLKNNGLDEEILRTALYRELLFDSVMQRVAANSPAVSDIDIRLFYEMHRERFTKPEIRMASHILITINPDFDDNTETAALARMQDMLHKLDGRSNRFKKFAKRYSECPTAMEGGKLGEVQRGQLFPELDEMLFSMEEDQISPIVQSEMGYHVLYCEKIRPAKTLPFNTVVPRIRGKLEERHRRNCQKHWISTLKTSA